jgi:hypothetical protein
MRVLDWKSWLPLALIVIAAFLLYYAISGRGDELLSPGLGAKFRLSDV